jgi:hypothetical protein
MNELKIEGILCSYVEQGTAIEDNNITYRLFQMLRNVCIFVALRSINRQHPLTGAPYFLSCSPR